MDMIARALGMDPLRLPPAQRAAATATCRRSATSTSTSTLSRRSARRRRGGRTGPAPRGPTSAAASPRREHAQPGASSAVVTRRTTDGGVRRSRRARPRAPACTRCCGRSSPRRSALPSAACASTLRGPDHAPPDAGVGRQPRHRIAGQAPQQAAAELRDAASAAAAPAARRAPDAVRLADGRLRRGGAAVHVRRSPSARPRRRGEPLVEVAATPSHEHRPRSPASTPRWPRSRSTPRRARCACERIVTAHDVGTVINPLGHQGQIDGGTSRASATR